MKSRFIVYSACISIFLLSCGTSRQESVRYSQKKIEQMIEYAGTFVGTPYVWAGTTPKGFDCSGYVQYVFRHFGYNLPRTTGEQIKAGLPVNNQKDIQAGDLVFFANGNKSSKVSHVGLVVRSNKRGYLFLHSSSSNKGVTVSSGLEKPYKNCYLIARRIIE
ncbi:MAG: C40 family peptidase [Dysgonamonadaceae bacterium]|jgi:cell wall-associated NlpC family hydrolase|nr:C40 family peptidase [Dysgonamonadaceae bacterium]